MARPVVILFARTPRLGLVKRRLASDIGDVAALRFYRNQLTRMIRELASPSPRAIAGCNPSHAFTVSVRAKVILGNGWPGALICFAAARLFSSAPIFLT